MWKEKSTHLSDFSHSSFVSLQHPLHPPVLCLQSPFGHTQRGHCLPCSGHLQGLHLWLIPLRSNSSHRHLRARVGADRKHQVPEKAPSSNLDEFPGLVLYSVQHAATSARRYLASQAVFHRNRRRWVPLLLASCKFGAGGYMTCLLEGDGVVRLLVPRGGVVWQGFSVSACLCFRMVCMQRIKISPANSCMLRS